MRIKSETKKRKQEKYLKFVLKFIEILLYDLWRIPQDVSHLMDSEKTFGSHKHYRRIHCLGGNCQDLWIEADHSLNATWGEHVRADYEGRFL